ncbi:glycosyl hydrolase [Amphibiibacter pelophylacis]|uniref:Glycosyl hydrolase n=1 Tax=Amphibiibacter pelophylacis TaxID=1799477 RepID=A0ACC6P2M0_9BURK
MTALISSPQTRPALCPSRVAWRPALLLAAVVALLAPAIAPAQDSLQAGAARLLLQPRSGDRAAPVAQGREGAMLKQAVPTNQWYSSLMFSAEPMPLYAQPLSGRATVAGFEMALPVKKVVPSERKDNEIHYPHRAAITVKPADFALKPVRLSRVSDWAIDIALGQDAQRFDLTMAHGSPYVWGQISQGDLLLQAAAGAKRVDHPDKRLLLLDIAGQRYLALGPQGTQWEPAAEPGTWRARMPTGPAGARYFVLAATPDSSDASLALILRHAFVRYASTAVDWRFDNASQTVHTRYAVTPEVLEGREETPLLALYPHHWHRNESVSARLGPAYDTVRGPLKLLAARDFSTDVRHRGFVPWWPKVPEGEGSEMLKSLMSSDVRDARRMMLQIGKGPYWQGKGLQRTSKLLDIAEVQGNADQASRLRELLQGRIEEWFSGSDRQRYFHLDRQLGTVLSYPEEYFAVEQMNDHHFHYGYWIRTMAELALRDPKWTAPDQWGGMVPWLIRDIATAERGRADFPFLRPFDVYEGHSWASGIGLGELGNNQESSSEAINAWVGLILWGESQGDTALRDLGLYLYNTEIEAIRHYWFDVHGLVFPPEYPHVETSLVFGGAYKHNTWWTDEPRQIKGINLLPITTASTYLGLDPAHTRRSMATLARDSEIFESRGKKADPKDIWQDLFAQYTALSDPAAGRAQWDRWGSVEAGESRSHTLHQLLSLSSMGTPDFSIWADTPLHAVFKSASGQRTYLAFNSSTQARQVRFSDGTTLEVAPRSLAQTQR